MKKRYIHVFGLLTVLFLASCNGREKELEEIREAAVQMDSVLRVNPVLTVEHKVMAEGLISEYTEYVRNYPDDTLCAGFLMKSALLYQAMPLFKEELAMLDRLIEEYPESAYTQQALATAARVSEDMLRDYPAARNYLTMLKEKYPDGPYSSNIDLQIEYVGDPDGLLEAIMEKAGMSLDTVLTEASVDTVK